MEPVSPNGLHALKGTLIRGRSAALAVSSSVGSGLSGPARRWFGGPHDLSRQKVALALIPISARATWKGAICRNPWASVLSLENQSGYRQLRSDRYAAHVIPWIIIALVVVPLLIFGFVATRRSTVAREHPASEDAQARARTEQEFAEAEAYEEKWREEDRDRYHQERLP